MTDNETFEGKSSDTQSFARFPLASSRTPHFLRRFVYEGKGSKRVFEENLMPPNVSSLPVSWTQDEPEQFRPHSKRRSELVMLPPRKRHVDDPEGGGSIPGTPEWNVSSLSELGPSHTATLSPLAMAQVPPAVATLSGPTQDSSVDDKLNLLSPRASPTASPRFPGGLEDEDPELMDFGADGSPAGPAGEASNAGAIAVPSTPFGGVMGLVQSPDLGTVTPRGAEGIAVPTTAAAVSQETEVYKRIPALVDAFQQLPQDIHKYALFSMFRTCNRQTLSAMVSLVTDALRNDLLSRLPIEIADLILSHLDAKSLCSASMVCRYWYNLVEKNENIWKNLSDSDLLFAANSDIERARHEGWGYTGWTNEGQPLHRPPMNALGKPVNLYKAIYRRKSLIAQNWMSPRSQPHHFSIPCSTQGVITCLEFDEDRIIAGSDGKYINIYDTRTGELQHHFADHDGGVWALKYVNKDTLVSGSTDRTIRVWSISQSRCTHLFRGHSSTVRCLDVVMPVATTDPESGKVTYTPKEPLIVSGSRDATLRMWRLPQPGDPEFFSRNVDDDDPYFIRTFIGHTLPVRAINGYGDTIVSGSYDTTVRVWKASTGDCLWEFVGHQQKVYSAVIDAKRNRCISASMDWSVKVWCINTGSLLYTLEGHTSLVGLLDLNRTTLVSAAADSTLRVWDPETGVLLHKLVGHQGPISCFQHDERKVVSGSLKTLKLWNISTGELVADLFEKVDLTSIWQVGFDSRRCVAAVARENGSFLEVLDFDYDPAMASSVNVIDPTPLTLNPSIP